MSVNGKVFADDTKQMKKVAIFITNKVSEFISNPFQDVFADYCLLLRIKAKKMPLKNEAK